MERGKLPRMRALARWSGLFAGMLMAVAAMTIPMSSPVQADGEATARTEAPRRIAFWPDAVPAAIQRYSDGAEVLAAVKALGKHHRVQGSPGLFAAAKWVEGELRRAGYKDVAIERLPADGTTSYGHFKSYYGWQAELGRLEQVAPQKRVIADYATSPVALADYSQDADVTAELVDVGSGADAAAYQGKDVRGKIALADGPLPAVHRLAVEERGAAGFVSVFPNQHTAWSGSDPDLVRWGHLSPYQRANRFAFMISPRQAAALRQELARGPVRLSAKVKAKMVAASYDIVSATIAGSDAAAGEAGEIVLTAHLCHQLAGANDNASGSAALLGVARALQAAIASGALPPPKRTIRFLWVPEMTGSQAYLVSHPELAGRLRAGIHLDMVGGRPEVTHSALHLSRSAASLPHVINEISRAWVADVARASTVFAEAGAGDGILAKGGSRDALVPDLRPLELGSDHQIFEAFGVPMVYFHDWPDVTIHTSKDVPENLDATKLGRVTYMTAGIAWTLAALPDAEAARLPALSRASTDESLAVARRAALTGGYSAQDARLGQREALAMGLEELASISALWPSSKAAVQRERAALSKALASLPPAPAAASARAPRDLRDLRIPVRTPATRGPLNVYYYNHLAAVFGPTAVPPAALIERSDVFSYEALNLVDGKRTISDIRDLLAGRYAPVPTAEIAEWLEVLAKAGVLRLRASP